MLLAPHKFTLPIHETKFMINPAVRFDFSLERENQELGGQKQVQSRFTKTARGLLALVEMENRGCVRRSDDINLRGRVAHSGSFRPPRCEKSRQFA